MRDLAYNIPRSVPSGFSLVELPGFVRHSEDFGIFLIFYITWWNVSTMTAFPIQDNVELDSYP
jgi:hypothetical protein